MKSILTLLMIPLMSAIAYSQNEMLPIDSLTGRITFSEVVTVEKANQNQLYTAALKWYTTRFDKSLLQVNTKDRLFGDGQVAISYLMKTAPLKFTLDIQFRDGRYKYIITDLVLDDSRGAGRAPLDNYPKSWVGKKKVMEKSFQEITQFINNMKSTIQGDFKGGDW